MPSHSAHLHWDEHAVLAQVSLRGRFAVAGGAKADTENIQHARQRFDFAIAPLSARGYSTSEEAMF